MLHTKFLKSVHRIFEGFLPYMGMTGHVTWFFIHTFATDRQDVRVAKTMCGADCWTDHRLVVSKLSLRIQPARRPQDKQAPKRLDVSKLTKDSMRQAS